MTNQEETKKRLQQIKDKRNGILRNAETGHEVATRPEDLPPLREGYVRLVHQTHADCVDNLIDKGLIYNREYANKPGEGGKYSDITSMAIAFDENGFWNALADEKGICHKGADTKVIFDMPAEECGTHQRYALAQYLNGTISRGYIVGAIPNYGNRNMKLSQAETEQKKRQSLSNPLPENFYETPHWRENIASARQKFDEDIKKLEEEYSSSNFLEVSTESTDTETGQETAGQDESRWDDWDDWADWDNNAEEKPELNPVINQILQNKRIKQ